MATKNSQISPKYFCETCNIKTNNIKDYKNHILTKKHKLNIVPQHLETNISPIFNCNICGKEYESRSGLWRHNKLCNMTENIVIQDASANEIKILTNLVLEVVKSNTELQKQSQELQKQNQEIQKQNQDLQKQMIDVCQKIQPSSVINSNNNTTNSNNKTFNLNFFLNEQCKDAMNIKDFVKSIQIEMSDLERIGKDGYVEGISKLIIEKLRVTDIYKRPLHCSDAKRETMYIKENDVWNKDESLNNEKMIKFIKDVDNKNYDFLMAYAIEFPEVYDQNSKRNTPFLYMINNSTRDDEGVKKVIKKIIKEVVINKDN
jgi:hypothetical protein